MLPVIQTHSGKFYDFVEPHVDMIDIHDIAHSLSLLCRFTGHVDDFYSVAQHSVMVSYIVPKEDALAGLLHAAHEAYVGDVSSPFKVLLPDYRVYEELAAQTVRRAFGLPYTLPPSVREADLIALATEREGFMKAAQHVAWSVLEGVEPYNRPMPALVSKHAEQLFMLRFKEIVNPKRMGRPS